MAKKKHKWLKFRHKVIRNVAYCILYPYARLKYNIKIRKFKEQEKRPYLILLNHQTPFDQFFVGMSFKGPIYYLATEDIFSMGFLSKVIKYLVAPIPIKKQTTDASAVMNCIRITREGGTIAIAPEGNRTYSGETLYMNPAIAPLARKLGLPILLYRIEGGYGAEPRWTDKVRRGRMEAYVSEVISPEEYKDLDNEQLMERIRKGLYVNEAKVDVPFKSNRRAEYLERAIYVCPFCGLSRFESNKNEITCKGCGKEVIYNEDKTLTGKGFDLPFTFVKDWYDYQEDFINRLDLTPFYEKALYEDESQLRQVIVYKKKILLRKKAVIKLYANKLTIDENSDNGLILNFDEISAISVLGRNKLNLYIADKIYQFKGDKRFNALKYVNIYFRYKNISRGDTDGKFLGL